MFFGTISDEYAQIAPPYDPVAQHAAQQQMLHALQTQQFRQAHWAAQQGSCLDTIEGECRIVEDAKLIEGEK